jgi:hypothetical protein
MKRGRGRQEIRNWYKIWADSVTIRDLFEELGAERRII